MTDDRGSHSGHPSSVFDPCHARLVKKDSYNNLIQSFVFYRCSFILSRYRNLIKNSPVNNMKQQQKIYFHPFILFYCTALLVSTVCCTGSASNEEQPMPALKQVYENDFLVGTALNHFQISGTLADDQAVVEKHFNTITPENLLKWERVHPEPETYNFDLADRFIAYGEANDMFIVGHTLVWHNQTPAWVFKNEDGGRLAEEELLKRMRDHIYNVVDRYKGRIHGWDVVNEALNEDGSWRESAWYEITGLSYIEEAFRAAREADPDAELYYNDYNLWNPEKRAGAVRLVTHLQEAGVDIDGIGMQAHWGLEHPPVEEIEASIETFSELGIKVMITELDVDVLPSEGDIPDNITADMERRAFLDPYQDGLPESVQSGLADRYGKLFSLLKKQSDKISRVTFWGVNDRQSWKNNWPVRGRTNHPLLFDRNNQPKPALERVIEVGLDS